MAPMRHAVLAALCACLAGCCSVRPVYDISYLENAARLYIADGDGGYALPEGRAVFGLDLHLIMGKGYLLIQPGEHVITHACPTLPQGVLSMSGAQSIVHTFEAGKSYVVKCSDGVIDIAQKPEEEPR